MKKMIYIAVAATVAFYAGQASAAATTNGCKLAKANMGANTNPKVAKNTKKQTVTTGSTTKGT